MSEDIVTPEDDTGVKILLRSPNYLCVWIMGGLTGFIRWFQLLALGIYTFEITGSPFLVSLVPVLWGLPLTFCGPVIGGIADRVNRKVLLTATITMIFAVAATLSVISYNGELTFIHIAVASVLSGLFWATDMPIRRRLIGDVSGGHLAAAMSLDSATNSATRMLGPLMGGAMLQLVGITGVYILSAGVYAIAFLLILVTQLPDVVRRTVTPSLIRDLAAGVRFVLGNWELRRVLSVTIVFNMFGFPFTAMIPILGREQLGLQPFLVGFLSSLEGFGAFIGAMIVAMIARPANFARIFISGSALYMLLILYLSALAYVSGGPLHSFFAAALTLTAIGIAGAGFAAMQSTLTYLHADAEYRSRVLGVLALCIGSGPLGFLNIGWMAESYGLPLALAIMACEGLFLIVALWAYNVLNRPT
ncbi:MAG: MFS transporter [Pseudomonadota bacterium]|nr:MFS transporter [Pseudomonadota bacterium]